MLGLITDAHIGATTFLLLVISFVIINSPVEVLAAEGDTKITKFKVSAKSVYYGDKISFTGKLIDGLGYAISGATITIWDFDNPDYQYITSTTTSPRGEFKASIIAEYWDGKGDPVEIVAYFPGFGDYKSIRTSIIQINVEKPYASSIPQATQTFVNPKTPTNISLSVRDGDREGSIQVFPTLETNSGKRIITKNISIYENGKTVTATYSNRWSSDINLGIGTHTITASYFPGTSSYITSSYTLKVYVEPSKASTTLPASTLSYHNTFLSLQVTDGTSPEYIKVYPTLTYGSGTKLPTTNISIFVDKVFKSYVLSNQWSKNIWAGAGSHTIQADFPEISKYRASSDTVNYFVKAATTSVGSTVTSGSGSSSGVTSSDSSLIEYVIVGVAIAAAAVGVGIALSKRRKVVPVMLASPAKAQVIQSKDDTQFWVCPNCGNDTQMKDGRQYCFSCKIYLSI